jgi:hypothetical protein
MKWWWGFQLVDLGELISGAYCKKCVTDKSATFSEGWDPPYIVAHIEYAPLIDGLLVARI